MLYQSLVLYLFLVFTYSLLLQHGIQPFAGQVTAKQGNEQVKHNKFKY